MTEVWPVAWHKDISGTRVALLLDRGGPGAASLLFWSYPRSNSPWYEMELSKAPAIDEEEWVECSRGQAVMYQSQVREQLARSQFLYKELPK